MTESVRITDWETRLVSVGHALGIVVAAFGVGLLLAVLASAVVASVLPSGNPIVTLSLIAGQFVGFILVAVGYAVLFDHRDLLPFRVPSLRDVGFVVLGFVSLFVVALVGGYLIQLLGAQQAQNQAVELGRQDPILFLYLVPVAIFLVGPGEEMIFRGIVQGLLKRAYGFVPGLLGASVLFGVVHIVALQGTGKVTYMVLAAGLGLVLGLLYEYTKNLVVPSLVHGIWNAFLFGSLYVSSIAA
jgi:membrane protease YdiL (CAAX protease family)